MGLWHGVEYYEKEKIVGEEYYQKWSNVSALNFTLVVYFLSLCKIIKTKIKTMSAQIVKMLRFIVDYYVDHKQKIRNNTVY